MLYQYGALTTDAQSSSSSPTSTVATRQTLEKVMNIYYLGCTFNGKIVCQGTIDNVDFKLIEFVTMEKTMSNPDIILFCFHIKLGLNN